MRCAKAKEYLSQKLDAQLPPDRAGDLDAHLDGCETCRGYQSDLGLGRRLLVATEPELPSNFDWKLQLKLNQTLQRSAGEAVYPWQEESGDNWRWLGNFGAAAAVGLAAVLAVAVFFAPLGRIDPVGRVGTVASPSVAATSTGSGVTDRLPLGIGEMPNGGFYSQGLQQNVSRVSPLSDRQFDRGWSGRSLEDGATIQIQRKRIRQLQQQVYLYQRELQALRARLDTDESQALDTGKDQ